MNNEVLRKYTYIGPKQLWVLYESKYLSLVKEALGLTKSNRSYPVISTRKRRKYAPEGRKEYPIFFLEEATAKNIPITFYDSSLPAVREGQTNVFLIQEGPYYFLLSSALYK